MSVLFVHDGKIGKCNEKIYSIVYNNDIIKRYKSIDENVIFLCREQKNIKEERCNLIDNRNFQTILVKDFKSIFKLKEYCEAIKTVKNNVKVSDYIICRVPSSLGNIAIKYCKKYNKKYIVEVVGCPFDSLRAHSKKGKTIALLEFLKQRINVKKAKFVMYVTSEFLQKRYPNKEKNIDCSDVKITIDEKVLNSRLLKIKQSNRILSLGTIGPLDMKYKGFDTVIKAISIINKKDIKFFYKIMGNGDTTWLNKIINKYHANEYVKIYNSVSHEGVFKWLDEEIDIYIQPSKTEGMPRALIEAMSRACFCIGSNVGGISELLQTEDVFNKGDFKELIKILEKQKNKDILIEKAYSNFNKSKNFEESILEDRREKFYREFKSNK